jgi:glycosidase
VKEAKPDALLVGEVWSTTKDIAGYFGQNADELDVLFDFPVATAIVDGVKAGSGQAIATVLAEVARTYPAGAMAAPFLTNHDQIRVANQLAGDAARLRLAAAILLSLPGAPFLWQGEELGMQQLDKGDDPYKRTPLPWSAGPNAGFTTAPKPWMELAPGWEKANVATASADPASLLSRYRTLIRARRDSPALRLGDLTLLKTAPTVLAYVRRGGGETVLVVHNLGDTPAEAAIAALPGASAEPVLADAGATLSKGGAGWRARLAPRSSGFWRIR